MKKWGILFILVLGIAIAVSNKLPFLQEELEVPVDIHNTKEEKVVVASIDKAESRNMQINRDQVHEGNLVLVNQDITEK
jgi:hypothetical protein